jgi:hypothetical protein
VILFGEYYDSGSLNCAFFSGYIQSKRKGETRIFLSSNRKGILDCFTVCTFMYRCALVKITTKEWMMDNCTFLLFIKAP